MVQEQHEQVLFSLPLKRMEPIFKGWVREVMAENSETEPKLQEDPEIISRQDAKKDLLHFPKSDATIIKLEKQGVFKPMRLGRQVFYKKQDLLDALKTFKRI